MPDAAIRFMVELDPSGQVKAIKAIEGLGDKAQQQGKRFADGVSGGFRKLADEWARFVAGGVVLQRTFTSIGDTIRKAGDYAKGRQAAWDQANNAWRSDRMRQMTGAAALRLSGADEETIATVQGRLDSLKSSGRDVGGDFASIAKVFAQRGMQGEDLGMALKRAVEALGKRGHLDGFAESYAALAAGKGVAGGADLTDLATGLVKRSFAMSDDQASALREGIAGGQVGVGADGMVRALGEASAELAAALRAVNAAGGLSLGALGKPASLQGLDARVGYAYTERAAQDGGLDWEDPGSKPGLGKRPDAEATTSDYAKAAWESPVVQAAIAAAMIKGMDMALSSAAFKDMLARVFPADKAAAATSAAVTGGAAAAAGGTGALATISAIARMLGLAGTVLMTGGDARRQQSSESQIDAAARLASENPDLRQAYINQSQRGDERASQILEAMHRQLVEQTELMRRGALAQEGN